MRAVSITNISLKSKFARFPGSRQGNTAVMRAKVALLLTSTTNYEFGCCIFPAVIPLPQDVFHAFRGRREDHHIAVFVCVCVPIPHVLSRA